MQDMKLPLTLSRSLIVVILPGLAAIGPWLILGLTLSSTLQAINADHPLITQASALGFAVILGAVVEVIASHLEDRWDREKEKADPAHMDNWFWYLSVQLNPTPVAFSYVARLVTTLYFEFAMMVTTPVSLIGVACVFGLTKYAVPGVPIIFVLLGIGAPLFFYKQAKTTYDLLSRTRKELRQRTVAVPAEKNAAS